MSPDPTLPPDVHLTDSGLFVQLELGNIINDFSWFLLGKLLESVGIKQSYHRHDKI